MSLQTGLIHGKLPGQKGSDWPLLYVELYESSLHIFEGNEDPARPRRQMRTLELNSTDLVYNKDKDRKRDYRFQYERFDGKYIFKCTTPEERTSWVNNLHRMIQRKEYQEKGILPDSPYAQATHPNRTDSSPRTPKSSSTMPRFHHSIDAGTPPPPPPHKRDSGFVSGTGDFRMHRGTGSSFSGDSIISHGKSNSGDSAIVHNTSVIVERLNGCHSDDGKFLHRTNISQPTSSTGNSVVDEEELLRYDWYWGEMSRDDCTRDLKEKGKVGNFVVRRNNRGDYVMSFWRKDTVHHHRILKSGNVFQFEKSVVQATGENIPDLLDTYMKCCTDKTIGPYGGQLYPNYDDPWNPPEIDFNKMSHHLQKVKKESGERLFKAGSAMGEHTYGGLTLDQMNTVIEKSESITHTPPTSKKDAVPTPFAGFMPSNMSPSEIKSRKSTTPKSPVKAPKPLPAPKPNNSPSRPSSNSFPRKSYVNVDPAGKMSSASVSSKQRAEEEEEEEQELYIEPGKLGSETEESGWDHTEGEDPPLYENTTFDKKEAPPNAETFNSDSVYQNFVVTPPTLRKEDKLRAKTLPHPVSRNQPGSPGLYANVTYDGKPVTQPRNKYGGRRKT